VTRIRNTASVVAICVAAAATATCLVADGWRAAVLTLAAAAAVTATRIRFAAYAAAGLLAVVATLAVAGHTIAHDRPLEHHTHAHERVDGR
jgi:hypothetical protein